MQVREVGPCRNFIEKYYFDTKLGKCRKFIFGGCSQNDNNFNTLIECEKTCSSLIEMSIKAKAQNVELGSCLINNKKDIKRIYFFFNFFFFL